MAESKKKAQYALPASQVDLEARQESGHKSDRVLTTADSYEASVEEGDGRDFAVEGNDTEGYIGANPEYQTYANETEAPLEADESAESKVADYFVENLNTSTVIPGQQASSKSADEDDEDDEDDEVYDSVAPTPSGSSTGSTS